MRRAKVGDELELRQLGYNLRGFVRPGQKRGAKSEVTCLRPGTEIEFERRFVLEGMRTFIDCDDGSRVECHPLSTKTATMALMPGGSLLRPVDGIEFSDGRGMGLVCVPLGIRATVVQLPAVRRRKKVKQATSAPSVVEFVEAQAGAADAVRSEA